MQSFDKTSIVQDLEPLSDKWNSFGFCVKEVNGHDINDIERKLKSINFSSNKPSVLILHTTKGRGIKEAENNPKWHHKSKIDDKEINRLYSE